MGQISILIWPSPLYCSICWTQHSCNRLWILSLTRKILTFKRVNEVWKVVINFKQIFTHYILNLNFSHFLCKHYLQKTNWFEKQVLSYAINTNWKLFDQHFHHWPSGLSLKEVKIVNSDDYFSQNASQFTIHRPQYSAIT